MLANIPEKIEFIQCPKCSLIRYRNKWVAPDFEKLIRGVAKSRSDLEWEFNPTREGYEVIVHGWVNEEQIKERHLVRIKPIKNICPVCGRLLSGYYEAKIQLRGGYDGGIIEWIEKEAERIGRNDKMAFYRTETLKEGIDFLFGSKSAAKRIAQGLRSRFKAELTMSFQVAGRKEGKELRRTIISVRFQNAA